MPRKPYPFPTYENDKNFCGDNPAPRRTKSSLPKKVEDISTRLHRAKTASSARREAYSYSRNSPNDSLDFAITSVYNQHGEFMKSTAETLVQPKTVDKPKPKPSGKKLNAPAATSRSPIIRVTEGKKSIHSIKGLIEGHHIAETNRGYSRQVFGGFYAC